MNELALFAGAGGGLLGSRLLGWRTVCYVEKDRYCQKVLQARIKDGFLDDAPIWDDARTFDGRPWAGLVDVVTAGFPCQPFSGAGKQLGEQDERNLWPDTFRIIREVGPEWLLLENVSRLLSFDYLRRIFADLAESGFDARWDCIPASAVGAPHQRDRLWIVAHANRCEQGRRKQPKRKSHRRDPDLARHGTAGEMADSDRERYTTTIQYQHRGNAKTKLGSNGEIQSMANSDKDQQQLHQSGEQGEISGRADFGGSRRNVADANGRGFEERAQLDSESKDDPADRRTSGGYVGGCSDQVPDSNANRCDEVEQQYSCSTEGKTFVGSIAQCSCGEKWWSVEPGLGRVADGVAHRVDRLRAIGNGQVPAVVRTAWLLLSEDFS